MLRALVEEPHDRVEPAKPDCLVQVDATGTTRIVAVSEAHTIGDAGSPLRSWLEHYNAACVYALLLQPPEPFRMAETVEDERSEPERQVVARLAIAELTKAASCTDSGHLAALSDWLLVEDPDLDRLRIYRGFRDFEAQTFGSVGRAYQRGPRMGIWQQTAHVADIISSSGAQMVALWESRLARVREEVPRGRVLHRWVDEEREGWRLAERLAEETRDWKTRHDICRQIDRWARTTNIDLSRRAHPRYSDGALARQLSSMRGLAAVRPLDLDVQRPTTIARNLVDAMVACDQRLAHLGKALRTDTFIGPLCCDRGAPLALTGEWLGLSRLLDVGQAEVVAMAVEAWAIAARNRCQALALWFDDGALEAGTVEARREHFRSAMAPFDRPHVIHESVETPDGVSRR